MDIGHHQSVPLSTTYDKKGRKGKQKDNNPLKVVYISSPMKVRTSATRFRTLVQELTGKDSDISKYMDADGGASDFRDDDGLIVNKATGLQILSSVSSDDTTTTTTTTTTSDSLYGTADNALTSQMAEQFDGIYSLGSICDPYHFDVLGSYDDLM